MEEEGGKAGTKDGQTCSMESIFQTVVQLGSLSIKWMVVFLIFLYVYRDSLHTHPHTWKAGHNTLLLFGHNKRNVVMSLSHWNHVDLNFNYRMSLTSITLIYQNLRINVSCQAPTHDSSEFSIEAG